MKPGIDQFSVKPCCKRISLLAAATADNTRTRSLVGGVIALAADVVLGSPAKPAATASLHLLQLKH